MRLLSITLQYSLTATVITTFLFVLASLSTAIAEGSSPYGVGVETLNVGGPVVSDGAGLPFALDSFNGLELRDSVDENGESTGLDLVRRYPASGISLANNDFQTATIDAGATQYWYITSSVVNGKHGVAGKGLPADLSSRSLDESTWIGHDLRRRNLMKRSTTVYLSLTTCSKPITNGTADSGSFPQLEMYVSLAENLEEPGPGKNDSQQNKTTASGGYIGITVETDSDIYIGVTAPNSTAYSGSYKYQIAASIDAFFHSVDDDDPFLYFVDADHSAALLVTNNLTQSDPNSTNYEQWMNMTPPFTMFAHNINNTALAGLERSFCALDELSQVGRISNSVEVGMTSRGLGNQPKEQFYITGLNRSSTYNGILAMVGNSTLTGNGVIGGGGKVWMPMNFTTKTDDNCAVLFNLTFCSEVAYAVPSNPKLSVSALREIYDVNAQNYYTNFSYSLQQIQCNASQESMFSLTVGCDDCASAYKQWLCSVGIPRCADFSNNASYLMVRNAGQDFINGTSLPVDSPYRHSVATNSSWNPLIDTKIKPGPYKEILPCLDVCHTLVKDCPISLGFKCPTGSWANSSYGYRDANGDITCSYLGAAYFLNLGAKMGVWGSIYSLAGIWGIWWAVW